MASSVVFLEGKDKIKSYRKKLKLTQGDLENEDFSRGYFGLMENGNRNVTFKVSSYLASFFMEKAKEKGMDLYIAPDYFSRSLDVDAEEYCMEKLQENLTEPELDEILQIGISYNLHSVISVSLRKQGDFYLSEKNYMKAYDKYFDALELLKITTDYNEHNYVLYQMGVCQFSLGNHIEALIFFEKLLSYDHIKEDTKIYLGTLLNSALCYKKLNNIDKALEIVDKFISSCDKDKDIIKYIDILTIKSNCFEMKNNVSEAIEINKSLIDLVNSHEDKDTIKKLGLIYNNLGSLELKNKEISQALGYFNKSQAIRNEADVKLVSHTLIDKADVYIAKDLYDEAIMILTLGIEKAKEFKDFEYLIKGYEKLENLYESLDKKDELKEIILNTLDMYKQFNSNKKNKITEYYFKLQGIYFKEKNIEKAYECYKHIKDLNKF